MALWPLGELWLPHHKTVVADARFVDAIVENAMRRILACPIVNQVGLKEPRLVSSQSTGMSSTLSLADGVTIAPNRGKARLS